MDKKQSNDKARTFFDDLWSKGDPWELETSPYEAAKYARQLAMLAGRRYGRALEIGCGAGVFTRQLGDIADAVVGMDISDPAIARARQQSSAANIEYRTENAMDCELGACNSWDLIVMAETVCYLGWLYSFFDVAWFIRRLFEATRPGGRLLLTNTCGGVEDYLLLPWLIRSYHDIFANVGFRIVTEQPFRGVKNGVQIEALLSLFERPL